MGLYTYRGSLPNFMLEIEEKLKLRKDKHIHDELISQDLKEHLIEEIVELFQVPTNQQAQLWNILGDAEIDSEELVDVAAMCWGLWILNNSIR